MACRIFADCSACHRKVCVTGKIYATTPGFRTVSTDDSALHRKAAIHPHAATAISIRSISANRTAIHREACKRIHLHTTALCRRISADFTAIQKKSAALIPCIAADIHTAALFAFCVRDFAEFLFRIPLLAVTKRKCRVVSHLNGIHLSAVTLIHPNGMPVQAKHCIVLRQPSARYLHIRCQIVRSLVIRQLTRIVPCCPAIGLRMPLSGAIRFAIKAMCRVRDCLRLCLARRPCHTGQKPQKHRQYQSNASSCVLFHSPQPPVLSLFAILHPAWRYGQAHAA